MNVVMSAAAKSDRTTLEDKPPPDRAKGDEEWALRCMPLQPWQLLRAVLASGSRVTTGPPWAHMGPPVKVVEGIRSEMVKILPYGAGLLEAVELRSGEFSV